MTDYVRPSYAELQSRIAADLAAMPAVLSGPLSTAWAQGSHSQHGHIDWVARQCSPLTCELERLYDWAALYGVDRLLATAASGQVMATGNVGTIVLADSALRGANGLDYVVVNAVTLGAGATPVTVRCTTVGSAGNLVAGQVLNLIDPILGCANSMTVGALGLSGGAEDETVDSWRGRVADEWKTVTTRGARSGKDDDYRFWAKSAHPSVTGALIARHVLGWGTVIVRPICNGLANRAPTQAVLDAVSAYLLDIAPATADWRVTAPIQRPVNIQIHLLPAADTAQNRASISAALGALVLAEDAENAVLRTEEINAAIATVTTQYSLLSPGAEIDVNLGELLVLNSVAFS